MISSETLFGPNDPFKIAFWIADLPIYWYAILSMAGYFVAIIVFLFVSAKRYKVDFDVPFYYIFFALPAILLGARLWSVIIEGTNITQFFNFRDGGLAVQGGVVAGVITALIYFPIIMRSPKHHIKIVENGVTYIKRPSIWLYADAIIPTILLGQAIGRWGNFFNGEIFGQVVDASKLEWLRLMMPGVFDRMTPSTGIIVNGFTNGTYFQPLFLYESFLNIITFIVIYLVFAEIRKFKAGTICSLYFIDYGIIRFITETMRDEKFKFVETYIMNSILLVIGVILFIYCEWIGPKFRQYKKWEIIKKYFKQLFDFNKEKFDWKKYNESQNIRTQEEMYYYAGR